MRRQRKHLPLAILATGLLFLGLTSCQKKEITEKEPAAPQPAHEKGHEMGHGMGDHGQAAKPAAPKEVFASDEIRAAWTSVTIAVKDKSSGKVENYQVKPETEFAIPGTDLTLKAGVYLPDFSMTSEQITSRSTAPLNPALQVSVFEGGEEKYQGWLFSKFPDMHAFEHPKYGITLVDKSEGETPPPSM